MRVNRAVTVSPLMVRVAVAAECPRFIGHPLSVKMV